MSFIFGGGSDQAKADLNKIPQYYQKYEGPWWNAGKGAISFLAPYLMNMMKNPTALTDQIMQHYTMSPGAQYQKKALTDSINNAAAIGGELGSPDEQAEMADKVHGLVSQDQQQYYQNAMAPFQMALQGEEGVSNQGFNAGHDIAGMYGDLFSNEAQMDEMNSLYNKGLLGMGGGFLGKMALSHFFPTAFAAATGGL